jgi:pre-mRNA-processing factor SLU7
VSSFSDSEGEGAGRRGSSFAAEDDGVRIREAETGQPQAKAAKGKGARNLRVREDTAKYLLNLDVDSAFYDPKTRSMRENPLPNLPADVAATAFQGDLQWRTSGMATEVAQANLFAWEAQQYGSDGIHPMANPTQLEMLRRQFEERKAALALAQAQDVTGAYAPAADRAAADASTARGAADVLPRELLFGQSEGYVEYTPDGRAVAPSAAAAAGGSAVAAAASSRVIPMPHSRYDEDEWPGNHRSVWGSWFDREKQCWGFACCHETSLNSYCTGKAGIAAKEESRARRRANEGADGADSAAAGRTWDLAEAAKAVREYGRNGGPPGSHNAGSGSGIASAIDRFKDADGAVTSSRQRLDPERMKDALAKHDAIAAARRQRAEAGEASDDELAEVRAGLKRGRPGSSADTGGKQFISTAEEMEVYRMKRVRADDPMANFKGDGAV